MIVKLLGLMLFAGVATAANAASPGSPASVERFDVTFVSVLPDGGVKRETRPLRADEIRSMGLFDARDGVAKAVDDAAPPRPDEPTGGTVPDDLMRVNYHLAREGWLRDTAYDRTVPGGPWRLIHDHLRRGGPGTGGDCPPGAGDNCVDLN